MAVNFIILPEFFDYGLKMMETDAASEQQKFIIQVLSYVEEHYKSGELTELAEELRFDIYWLSKEIRKRTGKTYTDLVQAKAAESGSISAPHDSHECDGYLHGGRL